MTSLTVPKDQLPPVAEFLNTPCPQLGFVDYNLHFATTEKVANNNIAPNSNAETLTALIGLGSRPRSIMWPMCDSKKATFVPEYLHVAGETAHIPFHIAHYFSQTVKVDTSADNAQIGANINALTKARTHARAFSQLMFTGGPGVALSECMWLAQPSDQASSPMNVVESVLETSQGGVPPRFLVSCQGNILNFFRLSATDEYMGTKNITSAKPVFPFQSCTTDYQKQIERCYLRVALNTTVTAMAVLGSVLVLGLDTGAVMVVDTTRMQYSVMPVVADTASSDPGHVTAVEPFVHPPSGVLLVAAGYANGEVAIFNPGASDLRYRRRVEGNDPHVTLFRKFDLSFWARSLDAAVVVGHFKVSYQPVHCITTTMTAAGDDRPMLMAIGGGDGLVRILDFMFTADKDYGDATRVSNPFVTDVVANYFGDNIRDVQFSDDAKFMCVVGSSDLIEVFKMGYFSVNHLVNARPRGRSRSNTADSASSAVRRESAPTQPPVASYPPIVKDITVVGRFRGHTNTVHRVQVITGSVPSCYKIVSCGWDGKLMVWEFDYKALPRVKKRPTPTEHHSPRTRRSSRHHGHSPSPIHNRTRSEDATPLLHPPAPQNTMSSILHKNSYHGEESPSPAPRRTYNSPEIIASIYHSLYEVRLKRHYAGRARKRTCVHAIVDNQRVPTIEVSLVDLNLSQVIPDCKIDRVTLTDHSIWVFTLAGDIFRYRIET
ncbi:hypothetical protein DICA2_D14312 [Diutina catenulata]